MRILLSMAMVVGLAGCHRVSPQTQLAAERAIGEYSYRILVGPRSVAGTFTIQPDTVTLVAHTQACRRSDIATIYPRPGQHAFRCGGGATAININLDSSNPGLSTWSSMAPRYKSVWVCAKYEWNDKGESFCLASREEMRMGLVRVSGSLDFARVASTNKP